ncbi:RNA polymerase, sigma 54 subunit, RpoN [Flavobacteria bacterium MS024-3C]|jgi:RNA polymerase sigma-54 factor|nr:RNA polymerase, sigma 54 subunit, RpoN [Flavobacteria bacterium MS024-3C]MBT4839965.1 RNA polymerase factor sigma-54 [Flavobacteriaceae bacterium]MDA9273390.1 RNA polymerase factor sigma-54 [Flavobacteriaceae bacterium]MDA9888468.1 RNA polymerase factor sigma-54 [Flavobacteriaceae bacterium]MDB9730703.1 RNA polymerase factor sigma-54 [Flavobacteriaceae bacterium]|tara:strand:- start:2871 stop:4334 length:1464 start_codon:yes stop_codon:yes gene_type:complete
MLKQYLQYKLSQKLSPQQIQLMKLIQLPTQAFEQRLRQELEDNPALEPGKEIVEDTEDIYEDNYEEDFKEDNEHIDAEDINIDEYLSDDEIPDYRTQTNNYSEDQDDKVIPYAAATTFYQHLLAQLQQQFIAEEDWAIAAFLIGSIDETGYIRRPIPDLVDDLAFTENLYTDESQVKKVLRSVQQLDPAGVGATSLQECLLLQLERKTPTKAIQLAQDILKRSFEAFSKKHYDKLILKHNLSENDLKEALLAIEKLNPKPGSAFSDGAKIISHIVPDFSLKIVDGELELLLNGRNAPELHISRSYNNMLAGYKETKQKTNAQKETVSFIKQKLDAAKWFIEAIKQRQQTLYLTMGAIIDFQEAYFLSGDERKLKPMILKDIADLIDMDISTVSRVANSKYIDTPYGTKLVKSYFSEGMKNEKGEDVSTREIKKIVEQLIKKEDKRKPLTDDKLALILKEKGYPIARRTVAKYREQLELPVARLRKEI